MPPEIGSEFHWEPAVLLNRARDSHLPPEHELFATGCGAMSVLLRFLRRPGRLHVPSFFCMGVAETLSADMPLAWYRHLPDGEGPHWGTLHARPGDVVLAQNLFGREPGDPWHDWIAAHPGVTVLEDHSHDPFSPWARSSTAAYAVASLRKTLPVPDGGLLWSPQGLEVPAPAGRPPEGSHLKLAAMVLKAAWLDGHPIAKDAFRALQQRGEQALLGSAAPPSAFTAAVLPALGITHIRTTSTRNARAVERLLPASLRAAARPASFRQPAPTDTAALFPSVRSAAPNGAAPFRVQLLCPDEESRDALLGHLARNGIFAPVHWRQDRGNVWSGDEEAATYAARILTLPVDHRCGPADIHRLIELLSEPVDNSGAPEPQMRRVSPTSLGGRGRRRLLRKL